MWYESYVRDFVTIGELIHHEGPGKELLDVCICLREWRSPDNILMLSVLNEYLLMFVTI